MISDKCRGPENNTNHIHRQHIMVVVCHRNSNNTVDEK